MGLSLGIDTGTVSARWALIGPPERLEPLGREMPDIVTGVSRPGYDPELSIAFSRYIRIQGDPLDTVKTMLRELFQHIDPDELASVAVTGASAKLVSEALGIPVENEFRAAAAGVGRLYPDVVNIFEMGGENSKYIKISSDDGNTSIVEYETNGDCAAGTGSFMDQQAGRLRFRVEQIGDIVSSARRAPKIAGRCSVFAKSDMVHAQQKGYLPEEVLKRLCEAVARNFKSAIATGKKFEKPVTFQGGVAANAGVIRAFEDILDLKHGELIVPELHKFMPAYGAALHSTESTSPAVFNLRASAPVANKEPRRIGNAKPLVYEFSDNK